MTSLQRAAQQVLQKKAPSGENPVATLARGVIDINNNVIDQPAADGSVTSTGARTFSGLVNLAGGVKGTPQTLTGAGAVNLTTLSTILVTTGANALTLADGAAGQIKIIHMKTDGGDGTLTPAHLVGGTTLTFNDAGDIVFLYFNGTAWVIIANNGATLA